MTWGRASDFSRLSSARSASAPRTVIGVRFMPSRPLRADPAGGSPPPPRGGRAPPRAQAPPPAAWWWGGGGGQAPRGWGAARRGAAVPPVGGLVGATPRF